MIEVEKLPELAPPYEILELEPGKEYKFTVAGYEVGKMTIVPRKYPSPGQKTVVAVRIHVPQREKPAFPHYWDITPARLVYQLIGMLTAQRPEGRIISITRDQPGTAAHFSVKFL